MGNTQVEFVFPHGLYNYELAAAAPIQNSMHMLHGYQQENSNINEHRNENENMNISFCGI